MARTIQQIQDAMLTQKQVLSANGTIVTPPGPLNGLTGSSSTSVWRAWIYIVAFCQYVVESLFDSHVDEVQNIIDTQKLHTLQWYVQKAKAFQYGDTLVADTDTYATQNITAQIVKNAAAQEVNKGLRIKVAKGSGVTLAPLSTPELTAFTTYMKQVRDAGVRLYLTSNQPDKIKLEITIYYDPLVLDSNGAMLDGSNSSPIETAVVAFLNNLPFNGLFVVNSLLLALQKVPGVRIPNITNVQAWYGVLAPGSIEVEYLPDAGYMTLAETEGLTLTFIPHDPI